MKLDGQAFQNSDTCQGLAFVAQGAPLDMAEITISGRYPESGWAVNREVHEMVHVKIGQGSLAIRGETETQLTARDIVSIAPCQAFAWSGDMTIVMACSPAFSAEQYEIIEEESDEV